MTQLKLLRRATAVLTAALLAVIIASPASASPPTDVSPASAVDAYLSAHPGGKPISDNEISYDNGTFIVTLARPAGLLAYPDCPWGWYCFYERTHYGYPRGMLSACGRQSLYTWGWHDRVQSAYYNLPQGSVQFLDINSRIFNVGAQGRGASDVYPYRNRATHVNRTC